MRTILFLCTGNSCRSQMAEGYAKRVAPEGVTVYSAGIEKHGLNPKAVACMNEKGIDISHHTSNDLSEIPVDEVTEVITLCGHANETCPRFPGKVKRTHWGLTDPAKAEGSEEEVACVFREVRDDIFKRIDAYFAEQA